MRFIYPHSRHCFTSTHITRADSRCAPSPWETALLNNNVSHCLGARLESALILLSQALCEVSQKYKVKTSPYLTTTKHSKEWTAYKTLDVKCSCLHFALYPFMIFVRILYCIEYSNHIKTRITILHPWASYHVRKIAGCACAVNAGNVSPTTDACRGR